MHSVRSKAINLNRGGLVIEAPILSFTKGVEKGIGLEIG
jgi:hypothetical protein